jgi:hypothetical protein
VQKGIGWIDQENVGPSISSISLYHTHEGEEDIRNSDQEEVSKTLPLLFVSAVVIFS